MNGHVFEQLCAEDWAKIGKELLVHAEWRAGMYRWRYGRKALAKGTEPKDIVQEVIEKTFAGAQGAGSRSRKWDPAKGPLLPWLKSQVNSILDALVKSATHRLEHRFSPEPDCDQGEPQLDGAESQTPDEQPSVLDGISATEEQERAKRQVSDLLNAINGDKELVEMAEAIMEGYGPEPRILAQHLGVSATNIYNRQKRIFRYAAKVVKP